MQQDKRIPIVFPDEGQDQKPKPPITFPEDSGENAPEGVSGAGQWWEMLMPGSLSAYAQNYKAPERETNVEKALSSVTSIGPGRLRYGAPKLTGGPGGGTIPNPLAVVPAAIGGLFKGGARMVGGLAETGPAVVNMLSDLRTPLNPSGTGEIKDIVAQTGKGIIDSTLSDLRDFVSDPVGVLVEEPDKAANILGTVVPLAAFGVAKGGKWAQKMGIAGKRITGADAKRILGFLPDRYFEEAGVSKADTLSKIDDAAQFNMGRKFVKSTDSEKVETIRKGMIGATGESRFPALRTEDYIESLPGQKKFDLKTALRDVHSPDVAMGEHPFGRIIYDTLDKAHNAKRYWLNRRFENYERFFRGTEKGTPLDNAIFKVRESGRTVADILADPTQNILNKDELAAVAADPKKAHFAAKYLEKQIESALRTWGRSRMGNKAEQDLWDISEAAMLDPAQRKSIKAQMKGLSPADQEVWDVYMRKRENYMPHLFDKSELLLSLDGEITAVQADIAKLAPGGPTKDLLKAQNREKQLIEAKKRLQGGSRVLWDVLPRNVRFGSFDPRQGRPGFETSARQAYETYINGIARKIFDEPALREAGKYHYMLPKDLQDYSKWFINKFGGYGGGGSQNIANQLKNFQWVRTLGFNPRSAINNLTQRINTFADVPIADAVAGQRFSFTPEARAMFDKSGLKQSIGEKFVEGAAPSTKWDAIRKTAGYLFQKAEEGNLRHAFSTGYLQAKKAGLSDYQAMDAGVKLAEKHHFKYGRIGTSRMMSGMGGVAFQFTGSYPVKQMEFLAKIAREDPKKLVKWWAISEGVKGTADDLLGMDLTSAVGMPIDYGSAIHTLSSLSEGDLKKAGFYASRSFKAGGFAPSGFTGPLPSSLAALAKSDNVLEEVIKQTVPVVAQRAWQGARSVTQRTPEDVAQGKYPIYSGNTGARLYNQDLPDVIARTIGPARSEESRALRMVQDEKDLGKFGTNLLKASYDRLAKIHEFAPEKFDAAMDKEIDGLMKYGLSPNRAALKAALERLTKDQTERLKTPPKRYQFVEYMKK